MATIVVHVSHGDLEARAGVGRNRRLPRREGACQRAWGVALERKVLTVGVRPAGRLVVSGCCL